MASPPRATGKAAQDPEKTQEVLPAPEVIRRQWAELTHTFCAENPRDALCLFLQVHHCIFDRIAGSKIPQMVALNPVFARRFFLVCEKFRDGDDLDANARLWRRAFDYYNGHRDQIVQTLVRMAEAHILEDLSEALYDLERQTKTPIERGQFEAALNAILACLKELDVEDSENVFDFLWFNLCRHFGIFRKIQEVKVAQLREAAWEEYLLHRRFAASQRAKKKR